MLLKGPSFEVNLEEGARITLTLNESYRKNCTKDMIFIDTDHFPKLIHSLRKGDRIFLDEGQISLYIRDIGFDCINCIVEEGGLLGSFKRVYVPKKRLNPSTIHAAFLNDLKFASEIDVSRQHFHNYQIANFFLPFSIQADFVFSNFVVNAAMIKEARLHLPGKTRVFTKLESQESIMK